MNETIVLIDGMYLVFSSFYANQNMQTLKGEPTGAVFGFISRVESLIQELQPHRIVVAFDIHEKNFRHELFPGYKAKRLAPPEDLLQQLPAIKEYLRLREIPGWEISGYEADDIIAALSRRETSNNNAVIIFSADKDLFQLVNQSVSVFHPKLKEKLGVPGIKEHFGVTPDRIVDFLSLTGDASDNIPGVPGVGEKTALKLLEEFSSLDNLLQNLDKVQGKLGEKIRDNLSILDISRRMIDLSAIAPLPPEYTPPLFNNTISAPLIEFYEHFSLNSLAKRFSSQLPAGAAQTAPAPESSASPNSHTYSIIRDIDALTALRERILREKYFAFDLETTDLEFFKSRVIGLSISFGDGGSYIPLNAHPQYASDIHFSAQDFVRLFKDLFQDPAIAKTGHNLKFDILHLKPLGIEVEGVYDDTMIMSYLLHPHRRAHNLKELTAELLQYKQTEYQDLVGKGKSQTPLFSVDLERLARYCIDDSRLTLKLVEKLSPALREKELETLYRETEMPLVRVLTQMEYDGVKLDLAFLKLAARQFSERIAAIEDDICREANTRFNINSSQQLGELLFEKMKLPVQKRTQKTKSYSTDNEVLMELRGVPIVAKIIDYRAWKKILSTYLEGLIETVDNNNRVHTSYNQTVAATGRLSSSNPNLQNIPVGETGGVNVRDAFIAEEGKMLLAADYSQIELRVMAHFSEDKNLLEAFINDFDIHQHTADTVFGKELFLSQKERRKRAKVINFSVLYGSGAFSLSKELGVGYREAQSFIDMYFEKYSGVKAFMERAIHQAETDQEVRTILGRRRFIPEILSANRTVKENGKRMAVNTIIQGSAADIIKVAMVRLVPRLAPLRARLIMQVHDELVFEYDPEDRDALVRVVKEEMEHAIPLRTPLKIDVKSGKTWGSMETVVDVKV